MDGEVNQVSRKREKGLDYEVVNETVKEQCSQKMEEVITTNKMKQVFTEQKQVVVAGEVKHVVEVNEETMMERWSLEKEDVLKITKTIIEQWEKKVEIADDKDEVSNKSEDHRVTNFSDNNILGKTGESLEALAEYEKAVRKFLTHTTHCSKCVGNIKKDVPRKDTTSILLVMIGFIVQYVKLFISSGNINGNGITPLRSQKQVTNGHRLNKNGDLDNSDTNLGDTTKGENEIRHKSNKRHEETGGSSGGVGVGTEVGLKTIPIVDVPHSNGITSLLSRKQVTNGHRLNKNGDLDNSDTNLDKTTKGENEILHESNKRHEETGESSGGVGVGTEVGLNKKGDLDNSDTSLDEATKGENEILHESNKRYEKTGGSSGVVGVGTEVGLKTIPMVDVSPSNGIALPASQKEATSGHDLNTNGAGDNSDTNLDKTTKGENEILHESNKRHEETGESSGGVGVGTEVGLKTILMVDAPHSNGITSLLSRKQVTNGHRLNKNGDLDNSDTSLDEATKGENEILHERNKRHEETGRSSEVVGVGTEVGLKTIPMVDVSPSIGITLPVSQKEVMSGHDLNKNGPGDEGDGATGNKKFATQSSSSSRTEGDGATEPATSNSGGAEKGIPGVSGLPSFELPPSSDAEGNGDIIIEVETGTGNEIPETGRLYEGVFAEILKSIVYGGLMEVIVSSSVVASAAASAAATLSIVALALASLIGGVLVIAHNLWDLRDDCHKDSSNEVTNNEATNKYKELLGRAEYFPLHAFFAISSFLVFGMVPPIAYGYSFYKTNDKDYTLVVVSVASLICVSLLALFKAYINKCTVLEYFKTVAYYITIAVLVSGVSYVVGNLVTGLMEEYGLFDMSSGGGVSLLPQATTGSLASS